jgi:hypothetical protein
MNEEVTEVDPNPEFRLLRFPVFSDDELGTIFQNAKTQRLWLEKSSTKHDSKRPRVINP